MARPDSSAEDGADPVTDSSAEDRLAAARAASIETDRRPARRADARVAMAETMLAHGRAARDGGDRYQAVVLVDAAVLAGGEGRCHLHDGPALPADTALRLACDAAVVARSLGHGGEPLTVGTLHESHPAGAGSVHVCVRIPDVEVHGCAGAAGPCASATRPGKAAAPSASRRPGRRRRPRISSGVLWTSCIG